MVERAEKKLYLDRMVTQDGAESSSSSPDLEEDDANHEGGKLMSTLRFGCNAVFGNDSENQSLPSDADIELITDRARTQDFSNGNLKGGAEQNAQDFDIAKDLRATTNFAGIDFKAIRDQHEKSKLPDNVNAIGDAWRKRQRKSRIKMVQALGSGYGSAAVPVLAMNDYDLETGERSVFDQELGGRTKRSNNVKAKAAFLNQDHCQVCGDGGVLIMCPSCPVSVHAEYLGLTTKSSVKGFLRCPHHYCAHCEKTASAVGGFLFACSCCPNAYCEDCVPKDARMLEECDKMEELGYIIKNGTYIHCSDGCENVATTECGWSPPNPSARGPCPPELDVSSYYGGTVDDTVDCPDELIVTGKRQRKAATIFTPGDKATRAASAAPVNVQHGAKPTLVAAAKPKEASRDIIEIESSSEEVSRDSSADNKSPEYINIDSDSDDSEDSAAQKPAAKGPRRIKPGPSIASVAVLHERVGRDGTLVPTTPPKQSPNGTFQQPKGRPPHGFSWDATRGIWKQQSPQQSTSTSSSTLARSSHIDYEVSLPVTSAGLMLALLTRHDGIVVFSGYLRHADGRKGTAEVNSLVRNIGDEVVAINGAFVRGQPLKRIISLLREAKDKYPNVRVCFRTKSG
jgi:hypothetical protein